MTQLAGQSCVICHERIDGDFEAGYCPLCRCPRHDGCVAPPTGPSDQACTGCGAGDEARAAFTGRRQVAMTVDLTRPHDCPVCRLANPPGTARCECGYSFLHEATEGRSTVRGVAARNLARGIVTLAGGLIVTAVTLTTSPHTGFYVVAYGAVLVGAGLCVRGLIQLNRARRIPTPPPE